MTATEWRDVRRPAPRSKGLVVVLPNTATLTAFLLGFVLQFNPLSSTFGMPFLRLSDAVMFIAAFFFFWRLRKNELVPIGLRVAAFGGLVGLSVLFKAYPLNGDVYFSLMLWASFLVSAMLVAIEPREPRLASALAVGMLLGMVPSTVVLILRAAGVDLTPIGLGVTIVGKIGFGAELAKAKPGGLWAHGNEAGHVYALAGAAALYLSYRFKKPAIYGLYYLLFLATFVVTLNRGGVIAPSIGLAVAYVTTGRGGIMMRLFLASTGAISVLAIISWLPAFEGLRLAFTSRFEGDSNIIHNLADRSNTLVGGLNVAVANPFGIGLFERTQQLITASHVASGSPHNAILSLSYQSGLSIMLLYLVCFWRLWRRRAGTISLPVLMAFFALPSMFFEELTLNPDFLFAIALTIAAGLRPSVGSTKTSVSAYSDSSKAMRQGMRL